MADEGTMDGGTPAVGGAGNEQNTPQGAGASTPAQGADAGGGGNAGGSLLSDDAQAAARAEKDKQAEPGDGTPAEAPFAVEDLAVPEGFNASQDDLKRFQEFALGMGLNKEQAQQLVDMQHANVLAAQQQHAEQVQHWAEQVRMDKEMGGTALQATVMEAKSALGAFDGDGKVFGMLEQTGYANHPEVIRFLSRIGKALGEDKVVTGKGTDQEKPLWDRLYPADKK